MPVLRLGALLATLACISGAFAQNVTVRPGDSLWALAQRHGTTVEALRRANALASDALVPGMQLTLPSGSDAAPNRYTVGAGDTLYDIALAFNVSVDDLIAFNDLDGSVIRPGQVLRITRSAGAEPLKVTVQPGDSLWKIARAYDLDVHAVAQANGIDAGTVINPGVELVIPGRYAGPAVDQGGAASPEITVEKGDSLWKIARRYDTTVAALMAANGLRSENVQAGQVLKIVSGKELVRAQPNGSGPAPAGTLGMVWPLQGQITSRFGYRRLRISGSNMHYGLDIDGRTGDPIRSATAGVVSYADWMGGYGQLVIVSSGDTEYYYAHASELLVVPGQHVAAGEVIARVGSTGLSTGSHLHFEVRVNGTPVDPLVILETQAAR